MMGEHLRGNLAGVFSTDEIVIGSKSIEAGMCLIELIYLLRKYIIQIK